LPRADVNGAKHVSNKEEYGMHVGKLQDPLDVGVELDPFWWQLAEEDLATIAGRPRKTDDKAGDGDDDDGDEDDEDEKEKEGEKEPEEGDDDLDDDDLDDDEDDDDEEEGDAGEGD